MRNANCLFLYKKLPALLVSSSHYLGRLATSASPSLTKRIIAWRGSRSNRKKSYLAGCGLCRVVCDFRFSRLFLYRQGLYGRQPQAQLGDGFSNIGHPHPDRQNRDEAATQQRKWRLAYSNLTGCRSASFPRPSAVRSLILLLDV